MNGVAVVLGHAAGGHGVRGAGAHQRDVAERLLDRGVAPAAVGAGVGGDVHAGRADLPGQGGQDVGGVAGPEDQRAVESTSCRAARQSSRNWRRGAPDGLPEPRVDDEDREDGAAVPAASTAASRAGWSESRRSRRNHSSDVGTCGA